MASIHHLEFLKGSQELPFIATIKLAQKVPIRVMEDHEIRISVLSLSKRRYIYYIQVLEKLGILLVSCNVSTYLIMEHFFTTKARCDPFRLTGNNAATCSRSKLILEIDTDGATKEAWSQQTR